MRLMLDWRWTTSNPSSDDGSMHMTTWSHLFFQVEQNKKRFGSRCGKVECSVSIELLAETCSGRFCKWGELPNFTSHLVPLEYNLGNPEYSTSTPSSIIPIYLTSPLIPAPIAHHQQCPQSRESYRIRSVLPCNLIPLKNKLHNI